ncbi:MAG: LTA synthase family protein [Paludibacteraceae bacterium]|nr:LTA synthase family protein [Paludibacteraceae bacterium]
MDFKDLVIKIKGAIPEKWDKKYTIFVSAFFISVLLKLVTFTLNVNGSLFFSSGMDDSPVSNFLMSYSIYAGVALLFVALGAFSKYFWPAFALDLILDIWMLADYISMRAHGIMITGYDFRLIGNMDGFWDSIFAYMRFSDLLLFISTGAFIFVYVKFFKPFRRRWIAGLVMLIISIPLLIMKPLKFNELWGLPVNIFDQMNVSGDGRETFVTDYTIFLDLISELNFCNSLNDIPKHVDLTDDEKESIKHFMIKPAGKDTLKDNLFILFVESMEGWTLNNSINGQEITPNFNAMAKRNAIYGEKMCPQTQRGASSDAQLLVNTGLMPLIFEAACFAYEDNYYYSIGDAMMKLGSTNMMLVPTKPSAWNQAKISGPWGFPTLHGQDYPDKNLFEDLAVVFDTIQEPFCIEAVTMASHAPFWKYAGNSDLNIPEGLPSFKENYIKSLNYTDKCFGEFIEKVKDNPKFAKTTFVILGDHCTFSSDREEFDASEIGQSLRANRGDFIPFIISSPNNLESSKEITDSTYQCDIYPTLLGLFKLDNYPWRGFGYDMSKEIKRDPNYEVWRTSEISEKIIRNDYFRGTLDEYK